MSSHDNETANCREIALRLNDTTLNVEKVSVNQVRHILRAAAPAAERGGGEWAKDAAILNEVRWFRGALIYEVEDNAQQDERLARFDRLLRAVAAVTRGGRMTQPPVATREQPWEEDEAISNVPDVHATLCDFAEDHTGDNGVCVVRAVRRALYDAAVVAASEARSDDSIAAEE